MRYLDSERKESRYGYKKLLAVYVQAGLGYTYIIQVSAKMMLG